ncbi:MAG: hypothetical protein JL56_06045 [Desulfotomaculum sp. BICA1-6]|nr:MAG: hypothetical protein JL56_06045 [Desulfotomaculum sp. BICA1-6]
MKDRLLRGFMAGVAGGVVMDVFNLASYYLGIAELRFLDWSALVIYGAKPISIAETVFALIAHLIFTGILGIIFAYLLTLITSTNYLLRGALFGSTMWFLLYGISLMYKIEGTVPLHVDTAASDLISAVIFGLVLAETLHRLDNNLKTQN